MTFDVAERLADALLFESTARPSANGPDAGLRWQTGIVAPDGAAPAFLETACLVEPIGSPRLFVRLRWLQLERCRLEPVDAVAPGDGARVVAMHRRECGSWIRPVERQFDLDDVALFPDRSTSHDEAITFDARRDVEPGYDAAGRHRANLVSERDCVDAHLSLEAEPVDGLIVARLRLENRRVWGGEPDGDRGALLMQSLLSTHVVFGVEDGRFVSLLDPPPNAAAAAAACRHRDSWPVLVGDRDARNVMLASPIVLPDFPAGVIDRLDEPCSTLDPAEAHHSFSSAETR
jgi:hypothetical protein